MNVSVGSAVRIVERRDEDGSRRLARREDHRAAGRKVVAPRDGRAVGGAVVHAHADWSGCDSETVNAA